MSTPFVYSGYNPHSVTVDPSGRYAYVANYNNGGRGTVSQYTIGADGNLAPMSTPTVVAGTKPYSITVDPSGKYAYVADEGDNDVSQYSIALDGHLTRMSTSQAGILPHSVFTTGTWK